MKHYLLSHWADGYIIDYRLVRGEYEHVREWASLYGSGDWKLSEVDPILVTAERVGQLKLLIEEQRAAHEERQRLLAEESDLHRKIENMRRYGSEEHPSNA